VPAKVSGPDVPINVAAHTLTKPVVAVRAIITSMAVVAEIVCAIVFIFLLEKLSTFSMKSVRISDS
jgi:hypothetical protein